MKRACPICDREDRAEIENALLSMASSDQGLKIDQIAEEYGVDLTALKMHAMFHTPLVDESDLEDSVDRVVDTKDSDEDRPAEAGRDSIVRQLKLRESDVLSETTNEYLVTLKTAGRRINRILGAKNGTPGEDDDQAYKLSKFLTKPMVDLYIGLGGEIRANVKTLADINKLLNGPQDSTATGLAALADAIRGSGSE